MFPLQFLFFFPVTSSESRFPASRVGVMHITMSPIELAHLASQVSVRLLCPVAIYQVTSTPPWRSQSANNHMEQLLASKCWKLVTGLRQSCRLCHLWPGEFCYNFLFFSVTPFESPSAASCIVVLHVTTSPIELAHLGSQVSVRLLCLVAIHMYIAVYKLK